MAKVDKILEAEKTIITISEELAKMKSAVELLESTKVKADSVIKTGESVVNNINTFVEQGRSIVEKIGDYDIKTEIEKIDSEIVDVNKNLKDSMVIIKDEVKDQVKALKSLDKKIIDRLTNLKVLSEENLEKVNQKIQNMYVILGLNLLLAGSVVLKIFGFIK